MDGRPVALYYKDGEFGAIGGRCLHVGAPLGDGKLTGDAVVCPWHGWGYNRRDGKSVKGYPIAVAAYELKESEGVLWLRFDTATKPQAPKREPHPLARPVSREPGPVRVFGISTTGMDAEAPRYSTSEDLLVEALAQAAALGCETKLIKLNEVKFKHGEGYYSKSATACTWPCTLTQMDDEDELEPVYNDKVASFIITGGQDNVQGVAGQMLGFFSEMGFTFPQFPYVAHTRGWSAEAEQSPRLQEE